ncbi:fibronectin type III domain-containing protein [Ruminococcaceae bacterium OttesenSCG-928-O06]|nr:fibronectin type III domain-containing protein [Ruminococcaceae bacterium OttesenSCG-928-O06]
MRIADDGTTIYNGITVNTPFEENDKGVKVEDFLQLMIAQLTNQDFMNPVDDTQYVSQLAQFATMQSMQELSHYSQTNYVTGLVGKSVTVATYGLGGQISTDTGIVTKIDLSGDEYTITVNGKQYKLSNIMSIADPNAALDQKDIDEANKIALIVQSTGQENISIRWTPPVSDTELAKELRYDIYYTTDGQQDFSTVENVKKGTLVAANQSGTEYDITGLEPGKTYFINVVVRNKNGDEAVYQSTAQSTKS